VKKAVWKADWLAGLVVSLVFLVVGQTVVLQSLERRAYDWGVAASYKTPNDRVAIIAIDDESIANIGRWPWPRDVQAKLIDNLAKAGAKVIATSVLYVEPQVDPGLANINKLIAFFNGSYLARALPGETVRMGKLISEADEAVAAAPENRGNKARASLLGLTRFLRQSSFNGRLRNDVVALAGLLRTAEEELNTDRALARVIQKAGNVLLGMSFDIGEPLGNPDRPLDDFVARDALRSIRSSPDAVSLGYLPLPTRKLLAPIARVGQVAAGIGHVNLLQDFDGVVRSHPLVLRYYDSYFPSLALLAAARSVNLGVGDIVLRMGEGVTLGALDIGTDEELAMHLFFYRGKGDKGPFPEDSFFDVYSGKIPVEKYRNKIVLIGPTALGVGSSYVTPISAGMAPVEILAHTVSSILNEDFFTVPSWSPAVELGVLLLVALYLMLLLPRLSAGPAAAATAGILVILAGTHFYLMVERAVWVRLMVPATLLLVGHLVLTTKRFLVTERGKVKADADSAESNRMLGLAFQSQGQLDMAFDKLRKVPVDDAVMESLYNLGLDFERKRQFSKAASVFGYMAGHDAKFKDITQRIARNRVLEDTVVLGGGRGTAKGALITGQAGVQRPMLGRYEVEKELGKGAMGVVYLGRDPKINRVVAIKTLALSQEFEEEELDEVRQRFFREAETAGRLNHPNIVTIYDAGEEHDLAYIAMELLKGKDLMRYTRAGHLLPVSVLIDILVKVAEALQFAHSQRVVHRDIKPANIMYEVDAGNVKVTDFGIARITDSSKTKTGLVLGTPSYMSPEQLAGKKVDGRSDLFSLGVTIYQLCTGQLPFKGESMASLMFKIANETPQGVLEIRADLPPCLSAIIQKTLIKKVADRYQSGAELAADLRACKGQLG